jgi:hypothetical protein
MAVTLNANSSTGFIATSDTSGVLQLQTGGTTAVTVDASQNVTLAGTLTATGVTTVPAGTAAAPAITTTGDTNTGIFFPAADTIAFSEGGAEAMRIDSSGNLGIGTTSPVAKLSVDHAIALTGNGAAKPASLGYGMYLLNGLGTVVYSAAGTAFYAGDAERARIDSSGDLLVGTTSAVTSARAIFNRSSGANIVISQSILSNGNSTYFSAKNNDTVQRQCDIGVYKHAGITNSAGYVSYVEEEGTAQYTWVGNDGNFRISSDPAAIGTNGGTVVGTQSSDERLKNIVGGLQYGLSQILALEPIAFAMKDSPNNKKIGFSAQQVQPIIPEAVYDTGDCIDGYDADPEDKMVQTPKSDRTKLAMEYTQIVPVLVKAIQEQQALITQLQADVAALKGASA